MGEIVTLSDYRPHVRGEAACLDCHHKWEAVTESPPEDVSPDIWLECPRCERMRGRYVMPFTAEAGTMQCDCGNTLFTVHRMGPFCPNCGIWHEFPDPEHNDVPPGAA